MTLSSPEKSSPVLENDPVAYDGSRATAYRTFSVSSCDHHIAFIGFVVMGTAAMAFWNCLIGSLYSVQMLIFPKSPDISDTITAVYTTMSLITTAFLLCLNVVRPLFIIVGVCGFVTCSFAIAFICQFSETDAVGVALFHIIAAIGGSCTGWYEPAMFGFASVLPRNFVGAACLGLGFSGLCSFALWLLFSKACFPITREGVRAAVWLYFSWAALTNLVALALFFYLSRRPWVTISDDEAGGGSLVAEEDPDDKAAREASNIPRPKLAIFRDCAEQILNVSLTLCLTLMMFPNIAPFTFGRSVMETDLLMGLCQCGDFFGRYLPNLRRWIPFASVKPGHLKYFAFARVIFIPLFLVIYRVHHGAFLQAFWFQAILMFAFLFSSGWICSLASMYVPESVSLKEEKAQAATMYILSLLLGLTIGVWLSKVWKLI